VLQNSCFSSTVLALPAGDTFIVQYCQMLLLSTSVFTLGCKSNLCSFLLYRWEWLRSIVLRMSVCLSMCLSVCLCTRISPEPHARSLPNFLCMLALSVARSSSGMFTVGCIVCRQEGVFFRIENALSTRIGGRECTTQAKYAICDCLVRAVIRQFCLSSYFNV